MKHYDFHRPLKALYDKAVETYARGGRDPDAFFDARETDFLGSIGMTARELYDFAEDLHEEHEPDWETVLGIQLIRRDYFLQDQHGKPSAARLNERDFPAREAAVEGIAWLPRLILKAKAKLRGELPGSLMYCCGGDRQFFRTHDIHPAEFLHLTRRHIDHDRRIVDWVLARREHL